MKKRIKKYTLVGILATIVMFILSACGHTHSFGKWETDKKATCDQDGKMVRSCECGEKQTKSIEKKEHEYESQVTKEAGCQDKGEITYTCKNCEDSYKEETEATQYTATELYELYKDSVGEIVVYDEKGNEMGLGSCFVYEGNSLITNYHVIEEACSAEVTLGNRKLEVDKVIAYDKMIDVAIIQIEAEDLVAPPLCDKEHAVGSPVFALGNSRGLTSTFSDGMITTAVREIDGVDYVQHDAPISGGNSGGPLFNVYGEVIGINTWTVKDSQNLNFAISLKELENLKYGKALTLREVYEKEYDPYQSLKNYIISNGVQEEGEYVLRYDKAYISDSVSYKISLFYIPNDDAIEIYFISNGVGSVILEIDSALSGDYAWGFFTDDDDYIFGRVAANSFGKNSYLKYSTTSINYGVSDWLELADVMFKYMLVSIDEYISASGVKIADLGFKNVQ